MIFDLHQGKETILNPKTVRKTERFAKDKKLSSYINYGFDYFSKAEYQLYPELLKQMILIKLEMLKNM